jgi:hypothetical protein
MHPGALLQGRLQNGRSVVLLDKITKRLISQFLKPHHASRAKTSSANQVSPSNWTRLPGMRVTSGFRWEEDAASRQLATEFGVTSPNSLRGGLSQTPWYRF